MKPPPWIWMITFEKWFEIRSCSGQNTQFFRVIESDEQIRIETRGFRFFELVSRQRLRFGFGFVDARRLALRLGGLGLLVYHLDRVDRLRIGRKRGVLVRLAFGVFSLLRRVAFFASDLGRLDPQWPVPSLSGVGPSPEQPKSTRLTVPSDFN